MEKNEMVCLLNKMEGIANALPQVPVISCPW